MPKVVIDPITRIEGHLRVETDVQSGFVTKAWSTGTLFRGVEPILKNRDPRDAWMMTQRVCGVCTYVHGINSIRAVEQSLTTPPVIPPNARIIRNLLSGAQFVHDHIVHFYALHLLDWVDVTRAIAATDMNAVVTEDQSISPSRTRNAAYFAAVKQKLVDVVNSGQLGPLANGYWGHSGYQNLSNEICLVMMADYLESLHIQARIIKIHALLGGKNPHPQSMLIGGVSLDLASLYSEPGQVKLAALSAELQSLITEAKNFVNDYYLPDMTKIAASFPEYRAIGGGYGNLLCYGGVAQFSDGPMFPSGIILNKGTSVQAFSESLITEHVARSWYAGTNPLHPAVGDTVPSYTGIDPDDKYSWLKAPRYNGYPMEVGPLARVMVAYYGPDSQLKTDIRLYINSFLTSIGLQLDQINQMYSTIGRTAARAIETKVIADSMTGWVNDLYTNISGNITNGREGFTMPAGGSSGSFLDEAPRGALGHWVIYSPDEQGNQTIDNYQMVVPSTWNFGPRAQGDTDAGPVEKALEGTPVANASQPLEVLRTVHSFDPCIACAVH